MTRDDIIRMAREADLTYTPQAGWVVGSVQRLERFAALVAARERAACAEICDEEARGINSKDGRIMALMIGERIRVRGEK